ncbi:CTTNBP2 N-terminal-like protein isoform X2 [Microplitis mediator]|uniref:CTTNBP2 N-terminal-like protein isoform X2 n=1 Tax=Microplitis mediator TaxID=375433 RepID=UPI002553CEDE|nr:CTTNBP2 N-terminal-like protein isoform X2 [Microplitis mediator]
MSGDYDTKSIIRSSGKSLSVVSNIKVRVSSRRELSPSPCAKKRRKYNCESCKSFNEDNMASQNSNSPGIGNLTSSLSTAGSSIAAPVSSQLPSSSLSVSTSLSTPSSSTSTSPSQSPSPSPMLSPSSISSMSQGLQQTAPHPQQKSNNFEPLDKSSSNTLKRNPKMELSKTDLLKLLGYLEGELQARDIVIAALKSEKMKHLLSSRYRSGTADPHAALARDVAIVGGVIRMENNQTDRQVASLEALVTQQRRMQCRMAKVLKEAEIRHRTVIKELEEEKRKHEHDTAQGDDITYGLEKERTRLKKELELERQEKKRLEMELKKENIALEVEKSRQKQIVLLLLAERKKIIMKYIEERKRSEDLAQILSEEKVRIDSMAEGLEEESKKSLQMEAEVEKQQAQFDMERQQYRQALAKAEKRNKELEADLEGLKTEVESWKNGATMRSVRTPLGVTPPPPPAKPANLAAIPTLRPSGSAAQSPTGIARSVTPRQVMRGVTYGAAVPATPITNVTTGTSNVSLANTNVTTISSVCTTTTVTTAPTNINATTAPPIPGGVESTASEPQTTDKRTLTSAVPVLTSSSSSSSPSPSPSSTTALSSPGAGQLTGTKKPLIPRGIPPPVPPNKPVVPPKKEAAAYMRRPDPNSIQETLKITKSPAGPCQPPIPASSLIQPASVSPIPSHQIEETKPR